MTFEALIRPRALQLFGGCILELSSGNTLSYDNSIQICADSRIAGVQRLEVKTKAKGGSSTVTIPDAKGTLFTDEWNYIVVTIDTNRRVEIYRQEGDAVHRVQEAFLPTDKHVPSIVKRVHNYIGGSHNLLCHFNGDIDEVLLWNRVVFGWQLKAFRPIEQQYLNTLVGYWPFDEGKGNKAKSLYASLDGSLQGLLLKPQWIPVNPVTSSSCRMWCALDLQTFDSRTYSPLGFTGEYWLSRSPVIMDGSRPISVQARFNKIPGTSDSILIGVAFEFHEDILEFDLDFANHPNSKTILNGETLGDGEVFLENGITVLKKYQGSEGEHSITIHVPDLMTIQLEARPTHLKNEVTLLIPDYPWKATLSNMEHMEGLCGNFNGQKQDDDLEDILIPVASQDSFFRHPVVFDPPGTPTTCDIETTEPDFKATALSLCDFEDEDLKAACLNTVCSTGDLTMAISYAQINYQQCLAKFIALNDTEAEFDCEPVCPNFCSFHGDCSQGVCTCENGFSGLDCSQQASFPCFEASWKNGPTIPIKPFLGVESAKKHYSYGHPISHSANTGNEISDAIVVYLYQEQNFGNPANSKLSLVYINDKPKDGSQGRSEVDIAVSGTDLSHFGVQTTDDPHAFTDSVTINGAKTHIHGRWRWWRCCTDGMTLGTLPSDFSLNFTFSHLQNIDRILVSQQNQFGAQDLFGFSADETEGIRISGAICENECGKYSNCSACSDQPSCGWCEDSGTCEYGSPTGPRDGRCSGWRFSKEDSESRILTSTIDYPVDPSSVSVILPKPLDVQVYVNFPEPEEVALEIVLLQDVSEDFGCQLGQIQASTLQVFSSIKELYPRARLGLGSFSDKPVSPYGSASKFDYPYATNHPLSIDQNGLQSALDNLVIVDGKDKKNSQLVALLNAAATEDMEWTDNARHVIIVVTNSPFHEAPTADYPSRDEVKDALLARNIIPIFIVPSNYLSTYKSLVHDFGFGYVSSTCQLSASSMFTEIKNALAEQSSSVKAIVRANGRLESLDPSSYSGMSPMTRVVFSAHLDPTVGTDEPTVISFPGYGDITITPTVSDIPQVDPCPFVSIVAHNVSQTLLTLTGSSMYGQAIAVITALPDGELYQVFNETTRGELITSVGTRVEDLLNRVFFVPGSGDTTISYKLYDYCEACSQEQTCSIQVFNVNHPPVANPDPDSLTLPQDTTQEISLTGEDDEGPIVSSIIVDPPTNGQLFDVVTGNLLGSGSELTPPNFEARFVPAAGTFGNPNSGNFYTFFTYRVVDSDSFSSPAKRVDVFVSRVNIPPTAFDHSYDLNQESFIQITLEASDDLGPSQLVYSIVQKPDSGTLEDLSQGVVVTTDNFELGGNLLKFTPLPDFFGDLTFTFQVTDSDGAHSDPALISLHVIHVNHPPVAYGDSLSTPESTSLLIKLANHAEDVDNDQLAIYICNWNGKGTLSHDGGVFVPKNVGDVAIPSGQVTYNPPPYENGVNFDSFTFKAVDPSGAPSSCETIWITVTPVENAPTTVNPGPIYTAEETDVTITIQGFDMDKELLTISICQPISSGELQVVTAGEQNPADPTETTFVYKFSPVAGFNAVASFGYKISDGTVELPCEIVSIYVNATNDPPIAGSVLKSTPENQEVSFQLPASDVDDDELDIIIVSLPTLGTLWNNGVQITSPNSVIVGDNVTYVPEPFDFGTRSFLYRVRDPQGALSAFGNVIIIVTPVNQKPDAHSDSISTPRNTPKVITFSGFDREDGNNVDIHVSTLPAHGSLQACDDVVCTNPSALSPLDEIPTKIALYSPVENYYGPDEFFIYATDSENLDSDPAPIAINVTFVNIPPIADPPVVWYATNQSNPITLILSGSDVDGPVVFSIPHLNFPGSLAQENGDAISAPGTVVGPHVIYIPTSNDANVQPFAIITYRVTDSDGAFVEANLFVNVTNDVPPPQAPTFEVNGTEDVPLIITLSGYSTEPIVEIRITSLPNGTLSQFNESDVISATGIAVSDPLGRVMFTPTQFANGFPLTHFSFEVVIGNGMSGAGKVIINVAPVNNPPFIDIYLPTVLENGNVTFVLEAEDVDLDREGDFLTAVMTEVPSITFGKFYQVDDNGQPLLDEPALSGFNALITNKDRLVYFEPAPFSLLPVPFRYKVTDKGGLTAEIILSIQVINVNDPPVAKARLYQGFDDTPITPILLDFSDHDSGDTLTVHFVTIPNRGTLFMNGAEVTAESEFTNQKLFQFETDVAGEFDSPYATFSYFVDDGNLTSNVALCTINIVYRNRPPVATGVTNITVLEDDAEGVVFFLNATDDGPEDDIVLTLTGVPPTSAGNISMFLGPPTNMWLPPFTIVPIILNRPWRLRFTPAADFNTDESAPVRVSYTLRDAFDTNPFEFYVDISVTGVNDAPKVSVDSGYQAAPADSGKSVEAVPAIITSVVIADDALVDEGVLQIRVWQIGAVSLTLRGSDDYEGVFSLGANPGTISNPMILEGTLSQLNVAISKGIVFDPVPQLVGQTGAVFLKVNDTGNRGVGGPETTQIFIPIQIVAAGELQPIEAAAALVGVTTLLSMGLFGTYKILKRRKIIPEEADPWENDELFDATLENPLFSGSPSTLAAVYDSDQE